MKVRQICASLCLLAGALSAAPIRFDYEVLASYRSAGLLSLRDIGTWNGSPITDTNRPSDYHRQLGVTTNFIASKSARNELFVQVTDVKTTNASNWSGAAFNNTALTGIEFWLPTLGIGYIAAPEFSDDYANPGQRMMGPCGSCTTPLSDTPGFEFETFNTNGSYGIHTPNYTHDGAFGEWGYVNGARRLLGGGVFKLTFDPGVDLFRHIDYRDVELNAVFGNRNQLVAGVYAAVQKPGTTPGQGPGVPVGDPVAQTPEPATMSLLGASLFGLAALRRSKKR